MIDFSKKTGFFESFDGTRIYYETRGSGLPLVMLYGIACGTNQWRHQLKYFSSKFMTVVFDYRGHGRSESPKDRENLSVDALAKDTLCLMQHLGLTKASAWGYSFGAQVLIRAFDMQPEVFENLVFINGFAANPIQGMFGLDVVSSAFKLFKEGYEQVPETLSYIWRFAVTNPLVMRLTGVAGGFNLNLTSFKDVEIYARGVSAIDIDVFLQLFEHMMDYNGKPVLSRIDIPTLIIGGAQDSVTPLRHQKTLHNAIKGSELLIVPYGSHCVLLDMPDLVNLRIEKFLNQHKYKSPARSKSEPPVGTATL